MSRAEKIATVLVAVSCLLYAAIAAVPWLSDTTASRVGISGGLVLAGEGAFWLGALIAGPAVMRRTRQRLSPRSWRRREVVAESDKGGILAVTTGARRRAPPPH
jgi:hypothetical protein